MSVLLLAAFALLGCAIAFAGVYVLARRLDNYGIVDVAWAYAFAGLAAGYALAAPGWLPRRVALAGVVGAWSLRLGTHLLRRVARHHPVEDGRYGQLRRDWAGRFHAKMAGFFQLQAGSVVFLGLPFLLLAANPAPRWHGLEIAAAILWLLAVAGESAADAQLAAFQRDPANRGAVCTAGWWRYSRHPNYFFEWLVWVAYALAALPAPGGAAALLAPATILTLLLRVTGIPLTEEQSIRSRGDAYRRYQQTTNAFIPWFPRRLP